MSSQAYLTKSRYAAGLQCLRRLWLDVHEPAGREEPTGGSAASFGQEIGHLAHGLFPGGVLVDQQPWDHDAAVTRTADLMADGSVPAIFEGAFEHGGVRVRVDVAERLSDGTWGLREVKGSSEVKPHYIDDVAVQLHVLRRSGVRVSSVEILHIETDYVLGPEGLSLPRLFRRADVTAAANDRLDGMDLRLADQLACLSLSSAPAVEPEAHCHAPHTCRHWTRCTASKPADWIFHLPRLQPERRDALKALGVDAISLIPDDFPLSRAQLVIRDVMRTGRAFVAPDLGRRLEPLEPPASYLDFEAFMPAVPLYAGTHAFETLPFQWSLHRTQDGRDVSHRQFLADGIGDPRRAFAESLLDELGRSTGPIIVYSPFERTQLKALARAFADLAEPIGLAVARLADLLPVVQASVYHPGFAFSYSIKTVAPALCPDVTYGDLDDIADGGSASAAFWRIASGRTDAEATRHLRQALLDYCKRDTWALVRLHQALRRMAADLPPGR